MPKSARGVSYYTVTDLGTLGGSASSGLDINDSGQVVGYSYNANNARRAFLYSNKTMTDLGTLGGFPPPPGHQRQRASGGLFVRQQRLPRLSLQQRHDDDLGTLPGDSDSYGRAINNSGQVVGTSRDFSYNDHAFLYSNGTMTNLGTLPGFTQSTAYDVNESGQVVG